MKIKKIAPSAGTLATVSNLPADSQKDTYSCDYLNKRNVIVSSEEPTTGEEVWFQRGKNLFNPNTDVELIGNYRAWNSSGNIISNSGYNGLKMQVKPNTTYSTDTDVEKGHYHNLCYFDENMTFLSSEAYSSNDKHFTTPNNCAYVTIAIANTYTWFKLEEGSSITSKKIHTKTDNGYEEFYNEENFDKNVYSYEEQRIGTWIDGRPLYRKVFSGEFNGKTNKILTDVLPITCEIKRTDGITLQVDGVERPLTFYFVHQGVEYYTSYMITQNTAKTAHNISFYCSNEYKELSFIVTIEYTKTTD